MFNPCGEIRWSLERPVSQIHTPHLHVGTPEFFPDLLKFVQMLMVYYDITERANDLFDTGMCWAASSSTHFRVKWVLLSL